MYENDCKELPVTPVFVIKFGGMVVAFLADFYSRSFFLPALKSKSSKVLLLLLLFL